MRKATNVCLHFHAWDDNVQFYMFGNSLYRLTFKEYKSKRPQSIFFEKSKIDYINQFTEADDESLEQHTKHSDFKKPFRNVIQSF